MDAPAASSAPTSQGAPGPARPVLARTLTRWSPLLVCLAALGLILSLTSPAKSVRPPSHEKVEVVRSAAPSTTGTSATGASSAGTQAAQASGTLGGAQPSTAAGSSPAGTTASAPLSRTGVPCTAGARQFPWSPYAPLCVPAFHGNNGGATTAGVTGSTITLSYREPNSNEEQVVESLAGNAFPDDAGLIADMQTYINYFNNVFELYGRKVVLKPFPSQGDYLEEDEGQDLAATQADAATAQGLGAFADVTFPLFSSQYYDQDLAEDQIVSMGGLGYTTSWYEQYAPYEFSVTPTGSEAAQGFTQLVCNRLAGLPAINAGETAYQSQTRVFGLITPDNPQYLAVGDQIQSGLQSTCNQGLAKRVSYSIDVSTFEQQATSTIAQLKAAGVTTVVCFCDPLFPILLDQAADQQQYYPEWLTVGFLDPQGRLPSQDQMQHAISQEGTAVPARQSEAYQAFEQADPGGTPAEQYYAVAYYEMLYLFDGLQAAGPDLTPTTLAQGFFSMPTSSLGQVGIWTGGQDAFSPTTQTQVGWWDPNAISNFDGQKGAWQSCDNGQWYSFLQPGAWAPDHTQFQCFGQ
jgi:hypothetical protein